MCGKETDLVVALIEDTELNVCRNCAKFGKILKRVVPVVKEEIQRKNVKKEVVEEKEIIQIIVPKYSEIIKEKRELLGLKQEDFAKRLNEKISLVHNIESGRFKPSINLARKIERFLGVKLVEEFEEKHDKSAGVKSEGFTIGDLIKIKE
jgi:putative transcription factor